MKLWASLVETIVCTYVLSRMGVFLQYTLPETIGRYTYTQMKVIEQMSINCQSLERVHGSLMAECGVGSCMRAISDIGSEQQRCLNIVEDELRMLSGISPWFVLTYLGASDSRVHQTCTDIFHMSTTPRFHFHNRSSSAVQIFWTDAFDPSIFMDVVSVFLPFSTGGFSLHIVILSLILARLMKRSARLVHDRLIRRLYHDPKGVLRDALIPLERLLLFVSSDSVGCPICVTCVHLLGFTCIPSLSRRIVLTELVVIVCQYPSELILSALPTMYLMSVLSLRGSRVSHTITTELVLARLTELNHQVAHMWLDAHSSELGKLSDHALIEVLSRCDLSDISGVLRTQLQAELDRRPVIRSIRRIHSTRGNSEETYFTRRVYPIMKSLDRQPIWGLTPPRLMLASVVILLSI
jgi:hypothetical protein